MQPEFSIITCTRNSAKTLPQTIASVQEQHGVTLEHVFVDGCSTDQTLDLIRAVRYEHQLVTGAIAGISAAMNAGIMTARGDIVAHLHSDDYYLNSDVLHTVLGVFRETGCDWMFGRIANDVDGDLKSETYVSPRFSVDHLRRRNFIPHPATFLRKEVFQRFGTFREDYRFAMDYEFWLRIAGKTKVAQLDVPLTAFRRHEGSASTSSRVAAFNEDFRARFQHCPVQLWPEMTARYGVRRLKQVFVQ